MTRNRNNKTASAAPDDGDKLPPNSMEAEQGVLGCCLLSPEDCLGDATEVLTSGQEFYDLRHQRIWQAMVALRKFDIITLSQKLKDDGWLEECGGLAYINSLPDTVPSAANLSYYLEIVREKALLRRLMQTCGNVMLRIDEHEGKVSELMDQVERELSDVMEDHTPTTAKLAKELVDDALENVIEKFKRGRKFSLGPSFGFNYIDNIIPGMGPGQMIVLAARPSTGKSAFAMQVAEHVAGNLKLPVAFFSLEMTGRSLMMRQIFQRGGANLMKFSNGFFEEKSMPAITKAALEISKMPIYYDENAELAIQDLEVKLRRMVRKHGVKVAFIDYFQLMFVRGSNRQWSKSDELAEVSKRIKRLAKELQIPIFVIAQMNRDIEKDIERRPRLSDLKDTGQLEQDADVVMFLWRRKIDGERWQKQLERIFHTLKCPGEWKHFASHKDADGNWWKPWKEYLTVVTCTVAKQREGPTADALLIFIKEWCRMVDAYTPVRVASPEKILEQEEVPEVDEEPGHPED